MNIKKNYCVCEQYGLDGTKGHTEMAATIMNPSWPEEHFLSCANHLHLYKINGFKVREFNGKPHQSRFWFTFPKENL